MNKIEEELKNKFKNDDTFCCYDIKENNGIIIKLYYLLGLVDNDKIGEIVLKQIERYKVTNNYLSVTEANNYNIEAVVEKIINGEVIVFDYKDNIIKAIDVKKHFLRSVSEPDNEKIVKGPKEGFIENVITNINLIRTRIRSNSLKFEFVQEQNPKVVVAYLDDKVDKKILNNVKSKLNRMILENNNINNIKELLKEQKYNLFNTVGDTGRVDICTYKLLEGKMIILLDGSPLVLYLPYLFDENFQTIDDYYLSYSFASLNRTLRFLSFIISILLPGLYVALLKFHQELMPVELTLSIAASRKGVPFSTFFECTLLLTAFEILREAGTKISSLLGSSLSIVGGLVIGQATVEARMISTSVVIIVAMSSITTLINSKLSGPIIIMRYMILFMGALIGMYGILICSLFFSMMLVKMKSFGNYYISDIFPFSFKKYRKTYMRLPNEK